MVNRCVFQHLVTRIGTLLELQLHIVVLYQLWDTSSLHYSVFCCHRGQVSCLAWDRHQVDNLMHPYTWYGSLWLGYAPEGSAAKRRSVFIWSKAFCIFGVPTNGGALVPFGGAPVCAVSKAKMWDLWGHISLFNWPCIKPRNIIKKVGACILSTASIFFFHGFRPIGVNIWICQRVLVWWVNLLTLCQVQTCNIA